MAEVDFEKFGEELGVLGADAVKHYLSGTAESLKEFGKELGPDMIRAVREDKPKIIEEIRDQARMLGELHRIRLVNGSWELVADALLNVAKIAKAAFKAAGVPISL